MGGGRAGEPAGGDHCGCCAAAAATGAWNRVRTLWVSECQRWHASKHTHAHTRTYRAAHRRVEHDLEHRVAPAPLVQEEELLSKFVTLLDVLDVAALLRALFRLPFARA